MFKNASMKVGKAIAEIRKAKEISQNKLSKLTNLNRGYIYKLENDQISPSVDMLERIAKELNIKVSDIIIKAEINSK